MIYIVETSDKIAIKIGYTKNKNGFKYRLITLQVGNHMKISPIYLGPGEIELESKIHVALEQYRLNGEWYDYKNPVIQNFASACISHGVHAAFWSLVKMYKVGIDVLSGRVERTFSGTGAKEEGSEVA